MPRLRNPDCGYVVTANNRVVDDDYPHYLSLDYGSPYRAQRIVQLVDPLRGATAEDMASIHADNVSLPGRLFGPTVGEWDGRMEPDSAGALVYAMTREQLAEMLCEREPLHAVVGAMFADDPMPTPALYRVRMALPRLIAQDDSTLGDWSLLLPEALDRALVTLEKLYGPNREQWRWAALHATRTRHPVSRFLPDAASELDPPSVASGGDNETVHVTGWETGLGIEHGSVARYVFDLADWDRSGWVVPLGSSGDPRSPHYADQSGAWARVELFPMTYTWNAIETKAASVQRLR
jgi:penicillin amidase